MFTISKKQIINIFSGIILGSFFMMFWAPNFVPSIIISFIVTALLFTIYSTLFFLCEQCIKASVM